jgi:hypothetical protein
VTTKKQLKPHRFAVDPDGPLPERENLGLARPPNRFFEKA